MDEAKKDVTIIDFSKF